MEIRDATKDDSGLVVPLMVECFNMKTEAEKTFLKELEQHHHYIIAVEVGMCLGLISWVMHGRPSHGLYELYHIGIIQDARGKGVANKLFKAMEEEAAAFFKSQGFRVRKLFIMTHDDNVRAHRFYEKMGAKKDAVLKSHYYPDKDEVVYSKFFNEVSTSGSSK
ncbi:MAG: GNAT family N-acetyltransferase [Nanoarchaeota archaeon]|nr:GNAT family N-acetyltransferase [Nanoarchaeota archaeon]